jgi:hypothetical protein
MISLEVSESPVLLWDCVAKKGVAGHRGRVTENKLDTGDVRPETARAAFQDKFEKSDL